MNGPLQILVKAAAEARINLTTPIDVSQLTAKLAATNSWPALQVRAGLGPLAGGPALTLYEGYPCSF